MVDNELVFDERRGEDRLKTVEEKVIHGRIRRVGGGCVTPCSRYLTLLLEMYL